MIRALKQLAIDAAAVFAFLVLLGAIFAALGLCVLAFF